jgi:hypothetical protein
MAEEANEAKAAAPTVADVLRELVRQQVARIQEAQQARRADLERKAEYVNRAAAEMQRIHAALGPKEAVNGIAVLEAMVVSAAKGKPVKIQ